MSPRPAEIPSEPVAIQPAAVQPAEASQAEALAGTMAGLANTQFVLNQMKIFQTATREQVKRAVRSQFTDDMFRQYAGAVCTVGLAYAPPTTPADAKVDCGEKPELAAILASRIDWQSVPRPDKYSLTYRGAKITLWFEGYWVRVGLVPED